jgi:uncharacterized protein YuzE
MKVKYDVQTDTLRIRFSDKPVAESDEEKQGVILDYDEEGNILGIEILNASRRMPNPQVIEYDVAA